jgi:hypothetical protein
MMLRKRTGRRGTRTRTEFWEELPRRERGNSYAVGICNECRYANPKGASDDVGFGAVAKTVKSEEEVMAMIMAELQKHLGCNTITRIRITRPATENWGISTRFNRRKYPPECHEILTTTVRRLQALYDIEWPERKGFAEMLRRERSSSPRR